MMLLTCGFFFFKQKTAYEMRISDWSSDVCSSDLPAGNLWLAIKANRQRLDGTDGAFDMRSNGLDIQGGWDYRPNARTVVGATFGYDRERFAVAGVDTSGKAQVYTGGAYAGFNPGAWTLSANLLYNAADTSYTRYKLGRASCRERGCKNG